MRQHDQYDQYDSQQSQNQGPSIPVKAWYQSPIARVVLGVCGVLLVFAGVTQIMSAIDIDSFISGGAGASASSASVARIGGTANSGSASSQASRRAEPADTVSYDGNGADGGRMDPANPAIGERITLPPCGFTRASYHFAHWSTNTREGTGPGTNAYLPGDTYNVAAPVTFFAHWVKATPLLQLSVTKEGDVLTGAFDAFDKTCDHCVLLVTNDSDETLALDAVFTFAESSGAEKGKGYDQATALAPGDFAILVGYNVYDASRASYQLTAQEPYGSQTSLHGQAEGSEVSVASDKATVELKNVSKREIQIFGVRCVMQAENGDLFVGDSYTVDTIAPGKTLTVAFGPHSMYDYSATYPIVPDFDTMQRAYFIDGYVNDSN